MCVETNYSNKAITNGKGKEMCIDIVEHKRRSLVSVRQELGHSVSEPLEGLVPRIPAQDDQRKEELHRQTPYHGSPFHLGINTYRLRYALEIFTVRNEVAKAMFLQASVCPHGGCLSQCMLIYHTPQSRHPLE